MAPRFKFCSQCGAELSMQIVAHRHREICRVCQAVFYHNPLPVASAVVVNRRDEVLLVRRKRKPYEGAWCLPMGFAETGETISEAALRELHEETGIRGRSRQVLSVESDHSEYYGDLLIVTFDIEKIGGLERPGDDAETVNYFPLERLPQLAFRANDHAIRTWLEIHGSWPNVLPMPGARAYSRNHMWLESGRKGIWRIGADAFLAPFLAEATRVSYLRTTGFHRPAVAFTIGEADLLLIFPRRMQVTECNTLLQVCPGKLAGDPYGTGWLFQGRGRPQRPSGADQSDALLRGREARTWMQNEASRMSSVVRELFSRRSNDGKALMADGGTPSHDLAQHLNRDELLCVFELFFSP